MHDDDDNDLFSSNESVSFPSLIPVIADNDLIVASQSRDDNTMTIWLLQERLSKWLGWNLKSD